MDAVWVRPFRHCLRRNQQAVGWKKQIQKKLKREDFRSSQGKGVGFEMQQELELKMGKDLRKAYHSQKTKYNTLGVKI